MYYQSGTLDLSKNEKKKKKKIKDKRKKRNTREFGGKTSPRPKNKKTLLT